MSGNRKFTLLGFVLLTLIIAVSCDPARKYEKQEAELIQEFMNQNGPEIQPTASGLYYIETLPGTGALPVTGDSVIVNYKGSFVTGVVFDSNLDTEPLTFALGTGAVIDGFDEGISYMKKGGKATLLVPSKLAYGSFGTWGIPGYTPVVFEIELLNIKRVAGK
jgi:FKBP-type peptidyl-prolyl cis-trans isomerase FkpA